MIEPIERWRRGGRKERTKERKGEKKILGPFRSRTLSLKKSIHIIQLGRLTYLACLRVMKFKAQNLGRLLEQMNYL
jgi:hypothetical protein